ncbi:histidine kinase [Corynebacterium auriscanis]|uniref:histidine kinase n=1 Tax=Corynebacterium auriscanis TaxID=99807 RepID=UPI003CF6D77A
MPFGQSPTRLGGLRTTTIILIALPIILIGLQLVLPNYQPSTIELVLLILQAPCLLLAPRLPQIAALSYVLIPITITPFGGALGSTSFLALVLIALLVRINRVIWILAVVCVSGFSGFYDSVSGTFEFDHVSLLVWSLLLCTSFAIGLWLRRSDYRATAARQQPQDHQEEMAVVLHDSIAANLSAITTKLEALAFQPEDNDPVLAEDMSRVADTARVTIKHTRQLHNSLTMATSSTMSRLPVRHRLDNSLITQSTL